MKTKVQDATKRIWIDSDNWYVCKDAEHEIEYIRADLVQKCLDDILEYELVLSESRSTVDCKGVIREFKKIGIEPK
jgi:hypothetical protein